MLYRVLIVDDSTFYRKRLTSVLEKDPSIQVIGHAVNGLEAVQKAIELKPDVIMMDVEMPNMGVSAEVGTLMQTSRTASRTHHSLALASTAETLNAS